MNQYAVDQRGATLVVVLAVHFAARMPWAKPYAVHKNSRCAAPTGVAQAPAAQEHPVVAALTTQPAARELTGPAAVALQLSLVVAGYAARKTLPAATAALASAAYAAVPGTRATTIPTSPTSGACMTCLRRAGELGC